MAKQSFFSGSPNIKVLIRELTKLEQTQPLIIEYLRELNVEGIKKILEKDLAFPLLSKMSFRTDFGDVPFENYMQMKCAISTDARVKDIHQLVIKRMKVEKFAEAVRTLIESPIKVFVRHLEGIESELKIQRDKNLLKLITEYDPDMVKLLLHTDFSEILFNILSLQCFDSFKYLISKYEGELEKYSHEDGDNLLQVFTTSLNENNPQIFAFDKYKEILESLIKAGVSVNSSSSNSLSPLTIALTIHNEDLAMFLIENRADLGADFKGNNNNPAGSVVSMAFHHGAVKVLEHILKTDPKIVEEDKYLPNLLERMCPNNAQKSKCIALVKPYVKFNNAEFVTVEDLKKEFGNESHDLKAMVKSYKEKKSLGANVQVIVEKDDDYIFESKLTPNVQASSSQFSNDLNFLTQAFMSSTMGESSDSGNGYESNVSGSNQFYQAPMGLNGLGDSHPGDCDNSI